MNPNSQRHSYLPLVIISSILIFVAFLLAPFPLPAGDSIIETEIKEAVKKHDVQINVKIAPNAETKKHDIYISPASGYTYSGDTFIYSVTWGISEVVSESFTYQLYLGMVLIDINNELWAISAENCRKIFKLESVEEQTRMLQQNLKKLR